MVAVMPAVAGNALPAGCLAHAALACSTHNHSPAANHAAIRGAGHGVSKNRRENGSRRVLRKDLSDSSFSRGRFTESISHCLSVSFSSGCSFQNQWRSKSNRKTAAAVGSPDSNGDRTDAVHSSSQPDEAAKSSNAVATAAREEARNRPADVSDAHQSEADVAAASEQDARRDGAAQESPSASASESGSGSDRTAASPQEESQPAARSATAVAPQAAVAVPALVALVAVALVLCNADRVIMSVAILPLSASNGWPPSVAGIVQSSFLWGYLITPIIGGSLADRYGGRPVLAAGLALWSLATLLTPSAAAHSLGALLTVRAVMGLGEGVALPCMNHMVSRYVPENRRAWAVGICFAGFHVGSMLGLLSAPSLMAIPGLGLTGPFLLFGALGLLWLALWLLLIPGDASAAPSPIAASAATPSAESGGQQEGKQKMQSGVGASGSRVTVWQLLSHPASWAIIIANTVNNWGYFILLSWMPLYFNQVLHTDIRQAAWFSAGPWAVMAGTGLLAAELANRMEGQQGMTRTAVRKVMQTAGFLGPAASLLLLTQMTTAPLAALCLTAALGLSAFSQAGWLLNHKDIAPRHVGLLHGLSNTAGTLAGITSTVATGFMVEQLGSFHAVLAVTAALYVLATVFWLAYATADVVFP